MTNSQSSVGVFTTDTQLVVRVWDAALARLTGISEESALGQALTVLVPDLEQRGMLKCFTRCLQEGVVEVLAPAFHHYLIPCVPVTQATHFEKMQQRVTIAPLRDNDAIAGLLVTVEDVTERLEQERELATRLAQGDEATRLSAAETLSADEAYDATSLLSALSDESWRVRRVAVKGVSQRAEPEAIAALLSSVVENHHNPALLNSALQVLAASDVDTLMPLLELLESPNADLRMQAALALGEQKDSRANGPLVKALKDQDTNVQYHAIEAVGKLKAVEAVDALAEIIETRDFFLGFAALEALTAIGDARVVSRMVPLLNDPLLGDRTINLLGQLGDESVVAPLVEVLNSPTGESTHLVAEALATLSDRYQQQYGEGRYIAELASREIQPTGSQKLLDELDQTPDQGDFRSLALVLGWLKGTGIDRALTRLMGRVDLRDDVIEALVRHGSATLDLLLAQLTAEDLEVRRSAVVALGRLGDSRATAAMVNTLSEESLAIEASNALAQIGDPSGVEGLLKLIRSDDASIRQAAVSALNSLIPPAMSDRIIPLLHDPDPNVRESAVKIAGYFGYPDSADALLALSRDENERVRSAAIEHLPYLEHESAFEVLVRAIREDTPGVRAAAARALGNLDAPGVVQELIQAVSDEDVWVRYFSARALGRQGSEAGVAALEQVVREEKFNHVRIAALDSLGQIGGQRSAGIVEGFKLDDDPDVARAAQAAWEKIGLGK